MMNERDALLQDFNMWFVPMVNPDGVWLSMRRAHASTYGKKNGRNTDGTCEPYANLWASIYRLTFHCLVSSGDELENLSLKRLR